MKKRSKKLFPLGREKSHTAKGKKFFGPFFQKRTACFLVLLTGCTHPSTGPCRLGRATVLPLQIIQGHLVTPVVINGQPLDMVFDTGSALTVLSTAAARRLGVRLHLSSLIQSGIGGNNLASYFETKTIQLGGLTGKNFPILVSPLGMAGPGAPWDGLLGTDFLAAYDIDLDLPDKKAILYKTLGDCQGTTVNLDEPLYQAPIAPHQNPLEFGAFVEVTIGGKKLRAIIDTGAPETVLFRDAARSVGLNISDLANDPHFAAGGTGPHAVGALRHRLAPLTVGEITVQNLPVVIVDQRSIQGTDMLLGMSFLSRVHVWFGFSSHVFVMQYPPKPSPR